MRHVADDQVEDMLAEFEKRKAEADDAETVGSLPERQIVIDN